MTRLNPITTPRHQLRAEKARQEQGSRARGLHRQEGRDRRDARPPSGAQRRPFQRHPDEVNWGHVGTLEHYASLLKRITDSAFKEGEHAD